jgi:tetratricopeptide (TPR) repeat protein
MKLCMLVLALFLVGCSATHQAGLDAVNRGDLLTAERLLTQAIQEGDMRAWNNLGVVYERMGDRDKAIRHYIMGARWGDPMAQRNLVAAGVPVPPADLAAQRAQNNAAQNAATIQLMNALNPPQQQRQTTNCSSYRLGNTIQTDCR